MKRRIVNCALTAMAICLTVCVTGCQNKSGDYITVVSREEGSGTRGAFVELTGILEKGENGTKTDRTTLEAVVVSKTDVMMNNILRDEGAIGYTSLGSMNEHIKGVKVDGIEATAKNISDGTYPLSRPFNIAYKEGVSASARDFVDFILSQEGQEIVSEGYVKVDENAKPFAGGSVSGKVIIAGSSSVAPIMEKLIEAYSKINQSAEIELQTSDSTSGMQGVMDGICDIGMASRELSDSEHASLIGTPIALDGIVIIVNNNNPVNNLTMEQIYQIFTGEVTIWEDV